MIEYDGVSFRMIEEMIVLFRRWTTTRGGWLAFQLYEISFILYYIRAVQGNWVLAHNNAWLLEGALLIREHLRHLRAQQNHDKISFPKYHKIYS